MEARREAHLSMLGKVDAFHTSEAAAIAAALPGHAAIKVEFDERLAALESIATASELDITGFAAAKEAKAQELRDSTFKVGNACVTKFNVDGVELNKSEMVDWEKTELEDLTDAELFMAGLNTWTLADPIKADLALYNVTSAEVDALVALRNQYRAIYQTPGDMIGKRAALLKHYDRLTDEMRLFLEKKLDQIFKALLVSNPLLYDTYQNARKISEHGGGSGNLLSGVVPFSEIKNYDLPFTITGPDDYLRAENTTAGSALPLEFYFASALGAAPRVGYEPIARPPGFTQVKDAAAFDWDVTRPFFTVRNTDTGTAQSFKFSLEE